MRTKGVLHALDRAIWVRGHQGLTNPAGLVPHSHAGSPDTSIAFTHHLTEAGITPSVGSVGDALDNTLTETRIGLCKTELTHHRSPWRGLNDVELATLKLVDRHNHRRPPSTCHDPTSAVYEPIHYRQHPALTKAGVSTT